MEKDKYLMKQCFQNLNAVKKFNSREEIERDKGNLNGAKDEELKKLRALGRLELSMRALQYELYKENEEDTGE